MQRLLFLLAHPDKDELRNTLFNYAIKDRSKFSRIGPHFSFQTQYNLCLYGNVCGTLIYGLFKICDNEKMNVTRMTEISDIEEEEKNY